MFNVLSEAALPTSIRLFLRRKRYEKLYPENEISANCIIFHTENVTIGKKNWIYGNTEIAGHFGVTIGDDNRIGRGVKILTQSHFDKTKPWEQRVTGKPVIIGNQIWIGENAIILPGKTLGNNCVIGAGSVITKDVPSREVWAGNPARLIKSLK